MSSESPIIAELRGLLDRLAEESITPEQLARLEELVLNHPEAEAHYIQFMSFYADLVNHVAGLAERPALARKQNQSVFSQPKKKEKPMKYSRTHLGIAASLLIVLGGLGSVAAYQFVGWAEKSRAAAAAQAAAETQRSELARLSAEQELNRQAARKALDEANAKEQEVVKKFQAALDSARKAIEANGFLVRLTGPDRIQPGAPNKWEIQTPRANGAPGWPRKLEVAVKDTKGTALFTQTHDRPAGPIPLELTAAFWEKVTPGSDLFLEVVAFTDDDKRSILAERIPLARPVYVTNLATDKPLYKPGETIRFRSLTLDRASLKPPTNDMNLTFRLRDPSDAMVPLVNGNGRVMKDMNPVMGPDNKPLRGIGVGEYTLSADAPGGEYKLDLYETLPQQQWAAGRGREVLLETRKFIVNKYVPDTFEKKLEFDGKSYGPGEWVQARVEVTRTAGGPMKDATAIVVATLDGREIYKPAPARFDIVNDGKTPKAVLNVRFQLPADIFEKAQPNTPPSATLSVNIQDGSDAEPIVRPIPLVTKNLSVEFFPEGGDMIEGLPGRVYFQVRTPQGKPADIKGIITDGTNTIAEVATLTDAENPGVNRGHGVFELTPKAGTKYFLKLNSPVGITEPTKDGFPLPVAKADGVTLTSLDPVTDRGGAVRVRLQANAAKTLHVGAYARGRLISQQKIEIEANKPTEVKLQGDEAAGGVTRITVFEEPKAADGPGRTTLIPRSERLVYRKPGEQLMLNINPDKDRYTPSDRAKIQLSAFNEKETPTPAILMVAVVNQSVITMADNKTDRLMPTHFLLSGEVKHPAELEHADFLLTDHPKAGVALDLLLATQGWRRFAEQGDKLQNPAERGDIEKLLVAQGQRATVPFALLQLEQQRLKAEFGPELELARLRKASAINTWDEMARPNGTGLGAQIAAAQTAARTAQEAHTDAAADLYRYESRPERVRSWGMPLFMLGLIGLGIGGISMAVSNPGSRRSFMLGSIVMFLLSGVVGYGIVASRGTDGAEFAAKQRGVDGDFNARPTADVAMRPKMAQPEAINAVAPAPMPDAAAGDWRLRGNIPGARPEEAMPDPKRGPQFGLKFGPIGPAQPPFRGDPRPADQVNEARFGDRFNKNEAERFGMGKQMRAPGRPMPGGRPPMNMPVAGPNMGAPAGPIDGRDRDIGFLADDEQHQETMPFFVREYAHERNPSLPAGVRSDFTETVYWNPVLVLPNSGKATIEFQLSDDIARYQVLVAGHTVDGRIGAITKTIEARKPFSLDPRLPLEISHTDKIDVPIRAMNDSDVKRTVQYLLATNGMKVEGKTEDIFDLAANKSGRRIVRMSADKLQGDASVMVTGVSSGAENDTISRSLKITTDGFPAVGSFSDTIEGKTRGSVLLPKDMVPGSLKLRLEIYPTSMADIVKGLEGMLQEPGGCFEQTSSSNYPNTMIMDYMNQTNQTNPQLAARAKGMLERGYGRLKSYECLDSKPNVNHGFEWFGATDMQHEALTAFGLLQFKDMSRVTPVDPQLIKRTQQYLLTRKDGNGGFHVNPKCYHTWSASKAVVSAYIVWALVESDPDDAEKLDVKKEIDALKAEALKEDSPNGKDAYFVALVANILVQRGDREAAHKLLDRLKEKHTKAGKVTGAVTSVTCSGGQALDIETTALSLLGWLRANDPKFGTTIKECTKWMAQQRGGFGAYGSTQSTILALKALTLYAKKSAHPAEGGELKVSIGGKEIAARKFTEKDVEVIGLDIPNPEAFCKAGENTEFEIATDAKQPYPFALSYTYTTLTPVSAKQCAVKIETKLAKNEAAEGETVPLFVNFENLQKQGHGMAVAIIGLPAGMKVPTDMKGLTKLREEGTISYFEIRGRELVLYWRVLTPEQKIALTVDLVCEVPGEYRGPASRGYLYYNADHKHWVEPMAVKIAAMKSDDAK